MDIGVKNKNYFIAASSKGIGFGIAKALSEDGANLLIGARNIEELEKAANKLSRFGGNVIYEILDASDYNSIKKWISFGINKFGTVDGLVVNAGGPRTGYFFDFDDGEWEKAFNLTLMSAVRMIREVLPYMIEKKKGSIVAVTSTSVKEPIDVLLLSNVMRSGVTSLIKSLAIEFGKYNIRFNNLVPGRIDTDRVRSLDSLNADKKGISIEEQMKAECSQIPLGRYGQIEEIGKAGAFLLSEASSYISGVTLLVDGAKTKTVW